MSSSTKFYDEGIFVFTIERESVRNAINYDVMDQLEKAIEQVNNDEKIKVLVITGEGNQAFCSGGDLVQFHHLHHEDEAYQMLSRMTNILFQLLTCKKITVALINGFAVGGGCELAAACDFRIANSEAMLGFIQGTLAITTGWGGGSILFEKISHDHALKLLLSAKRNSAKQLLDIGFIHHLYDGEPFIECKSFLQPYMNLPSDVIASYKEILVTKWVQTNIKERMLKEARKCAELWAKEEHMKRVDQFLRRNH